MAEDQLPKLRTRVRFPSPAHDEREERPQRGHQAERRHRDASSLRGARQFARFAWCVAGLEESGEIADEHRAAEREQQPCEQVFAEKHRESSA